jgi:hypothetical protein
LDDRTDHDFFASLPAWFDRDFAHGSAILLPDGRVRGRIFEDAHGFHSIGCVAIAGDDLKFHYTGGLTPDSAEFSMRHAQLFGAGTIARLKRLSIAVVGCSGTGSLVIMQLARLGVGKLVLVDPDHIEEKNLGRILPATMDDVYRKRLKVDVMRRWLEESGLGTQTETFACNLANPDAVLAVAACDVAFGCMDGVEGRHLLNRLAAFYVLPYFDVGVKLEADGIGGIDQISGAVHYLQPGGSSLLSRGVYKLEQVKAEGLKRTNPQAYREQVASKYISGVQEDRPAVVSVNMHYASMAVNEFLARLHPYRDDPNRDFAMVRTSLTQTQSYCGPGGVPCKLLAPHVGRGDVHPLLDRPDLSDPGGIR